MMSQKALTPAQIVKKLGQVERLIATGQSAAAACTRDGIKENMHSYWSPRSTPAMCSSLNRSSNKPRLRKSCA